MKQSYWTRFLSLRFFFAGCLLAAFWLAYWHWLNYQNFLSEPIKFPKEQTTISVNQGDSINRLANRWKKQSLIKHVYYLRLLTFFRPELKAIKAGEYSLTKQETPISLLEKMVQGQVKQYAFTIIEGMSHYQVIQALKDNSKFRDDVSQQKSLLVKRLDLPYANVEGWLFPDTYYISNQSSGLALLKRAVKKMQQVLAQEWKNRAPNLPYKTPYEALIMASIIEKETGAEQEREKIAGVFVRRLQKNMRLQTDPTVIYGIGENFNGDITRKDLKTATPYNTYIIKGLPPTPIAMPSQRSIYAALHPAPGDVLYFVADGKGGHYFSATLKEHNKAVRRYLNEYRKKR